MSKETIQQSRRSGYSFKEGLTMMAAKDVGIDPYLAAEAGEGAKAALNHLRKAGQAKNQTTRAAHIKDAQAELKSISAAKHPKLVNAIQAKLLALQGRGGDTEIAHLTPGEVVIPRSMQTPALMKQIAALAAQRGLNPAQLSVGHSANNINPKTGQREFAIEGWRKSYWQGGRDEARDPGIEEMVVTGDRFSPFDLSPWTTQIDLNTDFGGFRPTELSLELGGSFQNASLPKETDNDQQPLTQDEFINKVTTAYQAYKGGWISEDAFLRYVREIAPPSLEFHLRTLDDIKRMFGLENVM